LLLLWLRLLGPLLLLLFLLRLLGSLLLLLLLRLLGPLLLLLLRLLGPLLLLLFLLRLLGSLLLLLRLLGPLLRLLLLLLLLLRWPTLLPLRLAFLLIALRVRRVNRPEEHKQGSSTDNSNKLHANRPPLTSLLGMHADGQCALTMFRRLGCFRLGLGLVHRPIRVVGRSIERIQF
jgi:hypothetical protein